MTLRDVAIAIGFEVDENALSKVDGIIEGLKAGLTNVASGLDSSGVEALSEGLGEAAEGAAAVSEGTVDIAKGMSGVTNEIGRAVSATGDFKNAMNAVNGAVGMIRSTLGKFLGMVGIGLSLKSLNAICEEYKAINLQLKSVTSEYKDQVGLQNKIMDTAGLVGKTYKDTAQTLEGYLKNAGSSIDGADDALGFIGLMDELWQSAGKSQSEISSLHSSMQEMFKAGTVDGKKFEALISKSPEMLELLEKATGKSKKELKEMANQGAMSANLIKNAMVDSADKINAAYRETGMTVTQALRTVKDRISLVIAQLDEEYGITKEVANLILEVGKQAENFLKKIVPQVKKLIDRLGGTKNALKLIKGLIGAIAAYKIISKVEKLVKTFGGGSGGLSGVLGLLKSRVGRVVAVFMLLYLILDDISAFMSGGNSLLGDFLEKIGIDPEVVRNDIKDITGTISEAWKAFSEDEEAKEALKTIGSLIGGIVFALVELVEAAVSLGKWLDSKGLNLFSTLAAVLESIANSLQIIRGGDPIESKIDNASKYMPRETAVKADVEGKLNEDGSPKELPKRESGFDAAGRNNLRRGRQTYGEFADVARGIAEAGPIVGAGGSAGVAPSKETVGTAAKVPIEQNTKIDNDNSKNKGMKVTNNYTINEAKNPMGTAGTIAETLAGILT